MANVDICEMEKKLLLEECLNDIDKFKKEGNSKQEIFEKWFATHKSFEIFEIAYENSGNKSKAEEEMNLFIKQLDVVKKVFVIIQFLTIIAKGAYNAIYAFI
jgi:hypothetical protein